MRVLLCLLAGAISLCAQDYTPVRIVAITEYLPLARAARIAGDVEVKCFLDSNGWVARAEVVSGNKLLREQARQNALQWKFKSVSEKPGNTVTVKYLFRLNDQPHFQKLTDFSVDLPNIVHVVAPDVELNR